MRTKAEFFKEKIIITQTPFHSSKINNSLKRDKNSKQLFTYFNFPPKKSPLLIMWLLPFQTHPMHKWVLEQKKERQTLD